MAPRWPQVNNGPEHINEHATYLREACNQLQAADKGRNNQIPWNIVQPYLESTLTLIGKVLQQPSVGEVLHHIQDAAKDIQTIQRDITAVKGSIGLGTTALHAANFSGVKAARTSWAQVAAKAQGTTLPPPPPGPVQHGLHATKSTTTVTAYRDRLLTVKLKDYGIVQRYRNHPVAWTRQQVQNSIRDNVPTKSVKVVAAHQLKSGDLQVFTSTSAEIQQLKQNTGWLKGLGDQAELVVPTYGVIVHGIPTKSINIKDQKATIRQILADNYTVIAEAKISYVGWLTREGPLKRASSIVIEFTAPEMANALIYAGMVWEGHIHQCQLYDRACRVKQCFRCNHYEHIGTQCNAPQTCGYCAELHETKHCRHKGVEGFTPRCPVCKGAHTAWSNACPARKKELERVALAKQNRSIYWHVPVKENTTHTRTYSINHTHNTHEMALPGETTPEPVTTTQTTIQTSQESIAIITTQAEEQTPAFGDHASHNIEENDQAPIQASVEGIMTEVLPALPTEEEFATPETQQQQPELEDINSLIDPQLQATHETLPLTQVTGDNQHELSLYPLETIGGGLGTQDADAWLNNIFDDEDSEWMPEMADVEVSPPTSAASEPDAADGKIFKSCKCAAHKRIYDTWPTHDAELTIAKCMTVCMYCGVDYNRPPTLRMHLKSARHAPNNIRVVRETMGRGSSIIPSWKLIPSVEPAATPRRTRRRGITNSTIEVARQ